MNSARGTRFLALLCWSVKCGRDWTSCLSDEMDVLREVPTDARPHFPDKRRKKRKKNKWVEQNRANWKSSIRKSQVNLFIATNDVPFLLPGIKSTGNYYSNGSSRHFRPARRPAPHCGDPGYQLFGQHSAKRKGQCDAAHGAARRDHTQRQGGNAHMATATDWGVRWPRRLFALVIESPTKAPLSFSMRLKRSGT